MAHDGPVSTKAVQVKVTGRVQGVAFRWEAQKVAARLGLAGWVRNEPDGSVAGFAEGDDEAVDRWVDWCREGPPYARVRDVAVLPAAVTGARSFDIRY
jgi:acylphosphatase